jgi:alpha-mannosidase
VLGDSGQEIVEVGFVVTVDKSPGEDVDVHVVLEGEDGGVVQPTSLQLAEPGWTMYMVSHFHYDPVWWNTQAAYTSGWDDVVWAEDRRETFQHTGLVLVEAHMERARVDPDYKFVLAEVDYLKPFWDLYPDRRSEMRRLIADGTLEIVGGTYNEPNTNLTSPETAIRCAVYGMAFQRDVIGGDPRTAWQLDVFGHDPQFPAIMADCGIDSSSWARGPFHQWGPKRHVGDNEFMQFCSEFEWIAPNGRSLLTSYMPDHYSAGWELDEASDLEEALERAYHLFLDLASVAATRNVLLPVGTDYTPPNRWVTLVAREWNRRYLWPRFVVGLPSEFFDAVRRDLAGSGKRAAPQSRDMNPIYTGKDVSFIDTKQAQRLAETDIVDAEKMATFALLLGHRYPHSAFDKAWRQLVFGAHHDGITGSESDQVYLDLLAGWREAAVLARSTADVARREVASHVDTSGRGDAIVVFNSLGHARSDIVSVVVKVGGSGGEHLRVLDDVGNEVAALRTPIERDDLGPEGRDRLEFLATDVPPLGYRTYRLVSSRAVAEDAWESLPGLQIENDSYLVEADPARGGGLSRIVEKASGRDVLKSGEIGNELLVYPEYPEHPTAREGPWHLLPAGPAVRSGAASATVRAERSALGQRLVIEGTVDGTDYRQIVTLATASRRVDVRTYLDGFSGRDKLVRVRFPTAVDGGTPLSEVGAAVIARSPALIDVDSAVAPWTLDNPAQGFVAVGTTLVVELAEGGVSYGSVAVGVVEVVTPVGASSAPWARNLVVALVAKGVTATCSEANRNRYGSLDGDSNLPDTRISVGRPETNAFTASVLESAPELAVEFERQLAASGRALVFVPASRPRAESYVANADLRGARDLPVILISGHDDASDAAEVAALVGQVGHERIVVAEPSMLVPDPPRAPEWTVAVINRGTPGFAIDTSGAIHLSLLRSCTGWPSGVWIDPPRRTAPDGSSFELEHWSHVFDYALLSGSGDWRSLGCVAEAGAYNTALRAVVEGAHDGLLAPRDSLLVSSSSDVVVAAIKATGNGLAVGEHEPGRYADHPDAVEVTVRLFESAGRSQRFHLRAGAGLVVVSAANSNLLEASGSTIPVQDGAVEVELGPFEIRTLRLVIGGAAALEDTVVAHHEVALPVFSRYWLHNKGAAPVGNQHLAVHVSQPALAVRSGERARVEVTLASNSPDRILSGELEIVLPDGWEADPPSRLFSLAPGAHSTVAVTLQPREARVGRYFVAARVHDGLGQPQEDVVTVDVLPVSALGPYGSGPDIPPAAFAHPGNEASTEIEAELESAALALLPGRAAWIRLAVTNRSRSDLRGEAQLISPIETWSFVGPWTQGFAIAPGETTSIDFEVRPSLDELRLSSWALVKLMYFGRLWYSPAVALDLRPAAVGESTRSR